MRNLKLFLISISSALLLFACSWMTTTDYAGSVEFYLINNTSVDIHALTVSDRGYTSEFNILAGDTLYDKRHNARFSEEKPKTSEAFSALTIIYDTVYFNLGEDKQIKFVRNYSNDCETARSVYCVNEYRAENPDDREFKYYYTFTQDDYNNATLIEEN
ncbi:MAG: hypothetical protein ACK5L5_12835 [Bacteroidales bacterium]